MVINRLARALGVPRSAVSFVGVVREKPLTVEYAVGPVRYRSVSSIGWRKSGRITYRATVRRYRGRRVVLFAEAEEMTLN